MNLKKRVSEQEISQKIDNKDIILEPKLWDVAHI